MPRRFGTEISNNIRRRPNLTPEQRGKIIGAREAGSTYAEITARYGVSKSIISYTINQAQNRNNGKSKLRSGRPCKLNTRTIRRIKHFINVFPRATYTEVKAGTGVTCSNKTIYRVLRHYGIIKWRAKKRPFLKPVHARARLLFARRYGHHDAAWWRKVIFSDECSVERGKGKRQPWVFRTPQTKYRPECVIPEKTGKDLRRMVWAGFCGALGRSDLVVMKRDSNTARGGYSAQSYLAVLRDQIPRIWEPGLIYMQDNASIHTARIIQRWLLEMGVEVLPWPPYSPDLNLIENLWTHLKNMIYKVCPNIKSYLKGDPALILIMDEVL